MVGSHGVAAAYQMRGATGARNLATLGHLAAIGAVLLLFGCEMPFQTGSVRVTSTPPGARVFFDGSDTGRVTPYTIPDVSTGSHTISLTLDGHADWGPESVAVAANETATVNATLTPAETSGSEYGLGLELLDLQAYQSAYILRADPTIPVPSSIDIGVDFPPPRSQGGQGSCVGWAVAYALKSYHERIERGWPLTDERNLMSPAYVYNQIKLPGGGAYFTDALNLLIDQGVSSWSQMPYNPYDDRTQPSAAARAEAASYRIADWGTVQRTTHAVFVQEIKRHLAAADPVLIGVPVYPDFVSLSEFNPVYDDADGVARGYHAIVIVGYDDARSAFKVINSWGTDWGIGGYGWIDYEASRSLIRSAYVAKDARPSDERPEAVSDPRPADGAAGVAVDAVLRWTKNARTTSFDVYVGTDRNLSAADFQGNVAQATFAPDLAPGSKYYWRIDARGAGGVTTGPVWLFTTAGGVQPQPAPGITWREVTADESGIESFSLQGVAWGGSRFVAVGKGFGYPDGPGGEYGAILHSTDGITWSVAHRFHQGTARMRLFAEGMQNEDLEAVAWNGTRFVAVGGWFGRDEYGTIAYSADGITWTEVSNGSRRHHLSDVVWDGERFVASGIGNAVEQSPGVFVGELSIFHSLDGIVWTAGAWTTTVQRAHMRASAAWNGERFVFVNKGRIGIIWHSIDGNEWKSVPIVTTDGLNDVVLNDVVSDGERFVAVGADSIILNSADGITWTAADIIRSAADQWLEGVAWNGTRFVAVGHGEILVSP